MKTLAAVLVVVLFTCGSEAQWIAQPTVTSAYLTHVKFLDRNNGYILGRHAASTYRSIVLKTTDGGGSWAERIFDNCFLYRFEFVSRSVGWAVGITRGKSGLICKTVDGGATWSVVDTSAARSYFYAVRFVDDLHGWIGGWNDTAGVVLRTTNGGNTWQTLYDKALDVNDVFFIDTMKGWIVGQNGKIYKTTDAGATWQFVLQVPDAYSGLSVSPLRRIQFSDPLHGVAVGGISGGETKVWTSDGGVNWNIVNSTKGSSLHGLFTVDASTAWTVGGTNAGLTIQKTTDGGKTWLKQQLPALGRKVSYFEDVAFVSPTEGWIVADSGIILRTTNGGESPAVSVEVQSPPSGFELSQNYPNPFNPSTTIRYEIPKNAHVTLRVLNPLGQVVATLVDEYKDAGPHHAQWRASGVASGVFFYQILAAEYCNTMKMVRLQ